LFILAALPLLIWYPITRSTHLKIRQQLAEKGFLAADQAREVA